MGETHPPVNANDANKIHFTKYKQNIQIRISCTVMCTLLQHLTIIIKHFMINIYNSN
uniref:Uncharacterized protein n=1 Tax=Anguilla anguilla TaxID=7936 RepID=A0A0E9XYY1_ANGAN